MFTGKVTGDMTRFWKKDLTELKLKDGTLNTVAEVAFAGEYQAYGFDKKADLYSVEEAETAYAEIPAEKMPSKAEIVVFVNDKLKQAARQKAMLKAVTELGCVQPTLKTDPAMRADKIREVLKAGYPTLDKATLEIMVQATLKAAEEAEAKAETEESTEVSA